MARTAKIALTADVRGFKKATDEARNALDTLGKVKISPEAEENLKKIVSDDLAQKATRLKNQMQALTDVINNMGKTGAEAHDLKKVVEHTKKLDELKKAYDDISKAQKEIGKGKFPPTPQAPREEEGGGIGGLLGRGRLIMAAAGALGIRAAFNTRTEMARQRLDVMGVTTDQQMGSERSQFGFTPEERRRRLAEVARAAGSVTGQQATRLAEVSELAQRAFGVEQGTTAEAISASRKAGVQDQAKFVASAIGSAVASGLTGSKIGEYLSSMTSYMQSMSEGIDIDDGSLNGFAAAMGQIPFFKNDPNRIFSALQDMNTTFKGGDPFQKAQATRAILGAAPGAGPAATEFRRSMGLFGKLDQETMSNLQKAGMGGPALRAIGAGGPEIIKNIFDEIMKSTEGMTTEDRLYQFQQRTGMEAGPAASIFGRLATGKSVGYEEFQKAMQTPEELLKNSQDRLNKTMGTIEGKFVDLNATLSAIGEDIAGNIARPFAELGSKIDELIKAMGGDTVSVGGAIGTAAAVVGGAAALGAGKAIGKGAKAVGGAASRIATATSKGGFKGGATAAGRIAKGAAAGAGKTLGKIIPGVGLMFAAKDAWDVYEKHSRGEEITAKDWAVLSTSALAGIVGLVPGVGTAASVGLSTLSAGAELLPEGETAPAAPALSKFNMTPTGQTPAGGFSMTPSAPAGGMNFTPAPSMTPVPARGLPVLPGKEMTPAGMTTGNVIQGPWTTPVDQEDYNAPITPSNGKTITTSAPTPVVGGKDGALSENTQALRELTGAIINSKNSGQTQFGGRFPTGAPKMNSSAAPGKR